MNERNEPGLIALDWLDRVAEFHDLIGAPAPHEPRAMALIDRTRRHSFAVEEMNELIAAADLHGQADALIDGIYFLAGTMVLVSPPERIVGGIRLMGWAPDRRMPRCLSDGEAQRVKSTCLEHSARFAASDDLNEQMDGLAHALAVLIRAFRTVNLWPDPLFQIVHQANMAKVGPDGPRFRKSDNKLLKPQNWQDPAPEFQGEIERQSGLIFDALVGALDVAMAAGQILEGA